MRGREKFEKYKTIINIFSKIIKIFPKKIRLKLLYHFRKTQGNKGIAIRYILIKNLAKSCGDNVSIHPDVYIFHPEKLEIANNVSIHPMTYIEAYGGVTIGNDVSIAEGVTIMSVTHLFDDINVPIKNQGIKEQKIVIENNVWIGAKATILGNNIVHSGSIVGANAVVTKNVEPNNIVAGIPATKIRERK